MRRMRDRRRQAVIHGGRRNAGRGEALARPDFEILVVLRQRSAVNPHNHRHAGLAIGHIQVQFVEVARILDAGEIRDVVDDLDGNRVGGEQAERGNHVKHAADCNASSVTIRAMRTILFPIAAALALTVAALQAQTAALAIVGATIVDGNGGTPLRDGVIVVSNGRISAVGARGKVSVPAGAQTIDGTGKFVTPGYVDTNVHLSLYGGMNDRYETLVRYADRQPEIVLEAAQAQLFYGVTTVRDSYGMLRPLTAVRERIAGGGAIGPRILAAGNILGWS